MNGPGTTRLALCFVVMLAAIVGAAFFGGIAVLAADAVPRFLAIAGCVCCLVLGWDAAKSFDQLERELGSNY